MTDSSKLPESRSNALMAQIKLKTAIALYDQDQLKAHIQTLSGQQAQAEEEYTGLAKDLASELHELIGNIFYVVIGLHVVAALWHHFIRRDNTLKRML